VVEHYAIASVGLRTEVAVAADVARRGLSLAKEMAGAAASIKEGRDVVTRADVAVEDLIARLLGDAFGTPVIGEERGGARPADGSAYWLVDPICGTRNYASGIPLYCVNVALVEHDVVVGAVVADASTDETTVAERGRGTWTLANDDVRRVVATDQSRTIVVEDGKSAGELRSHAAAFMSAVVRADRWDFRSLGTTLAFAYLATGRIAAYIVFSASTASAPVHSVHSAAGGLLALEAGCLLTDVDGNLWRSGAPTLIAAATTELHEQLLDLAQRNRP
jgi:myo-inositol-1(or 4)-monophosphatase